MIIVPLARDPSARGSRRPTAFAFAAASLAAAVLIALVLAAASSEAPGERREAEIAYGPEGAKRVKLTTILPRGYDAKKAYPAILALPPGDGSAEMVKAALALWGREASGRGYVVVAPEIQGARLEGEAADLVPALFAWLDRSVSYDRARVALAGVSNGGLGVFFAAAAHPDRFRALLALPGGFAGPPEKLEPLKGKPVRIVVGERDEEWRVLADRTKAALEKAGARCRVDVRKGEGHFLKLEAKELLDWIERSMPAKR